MGLDRDKLRQQYTPLLLHARCRCVSCMNVTPHAAQPTGPWTPSAPLVPPAPAAHSAASVLPGTSGQEASLVMEGYVTAQTKAAMRSHRVPAGVVVPHVPPNLAEAHGAIVHRDAAAPSRDAVQARHVMQAQAARAAAAQSWVHPNNVPVQAPARVSHLQGPQGSSVGHAVTVDQLSEAVKQHSAAVKQQSTAVKHGPEVADAVEPERTKPPNVGQGLGVLFAHMAKADPSALAMTGLEGTTKEGMAKICAALEKASLQVIASAVGQLWECLAEEGTASASEDGEAASCSDGKSSGQGQVHHQHGKADNKDSCSVGTKQCCLILLARLVSAQCWPCIRIQLH